MKTSAIWCLLFHIALGAAIIGTIVPSYGYSLITTLEVGFVLGSMSSLTALYLDLL